MTEQGPVSPIPPVEQAKADSVEFSGRQLEVPPVSQLLLPTLESLRAVGLDKAEAVYIPRLMLGRLSIHPGWDTRIGNDYYSWLEDGQIIRDGQITKASPELPGNWAIVDGTKRPDYAVVERWREQWEGYQNGTLQRPTYEPEPNDEIERIIQEARWEKQIAIRDDYRELDIERIPYLPVTSRFGISTIEQDDVVFPKLAEKIGLTDAISSGKAVIGRPTLAEFNYLGNLDRFSHLTQYGTSEAVEDIFTGIIDINKPGDYGFPPRAIVSGNSLFGGVGQVDYMLTRDHTDGSSFRFVIVFT